MRGTRVSGVQPLESGDGQPNISGGSGPTAVAGDSAERVGQYWSHIMSDDDKIGFNEAYDANDLGTELIHWGSTSEREWFSWKNTWKVFKYERRDKNSASRELGGGRIFGNTGEYVSFSVTF